MRKMIPTDFVLTLPNILGHRCTCIKSHDQSRLISPRVRREFLIPVKMAENLVGYVRKNDVYRISKIHAENESDVDIRRGKCSNNSLPAHFEGSAYIDVIPKPSQYVESNTDVSKNEDNEIKSSNSNAPSKFLNAEHLN